ncbi:MAG TPA: NAD-dependent epimerase/dehydratase family protein [Saprospiraceae bacterium]|nr:NAD-dependent epimerase/dehydratase family protein [Saprospiraceae bacterium]
MANQLLEELSSGVEIQRHHKVAVLFGASGLIGNCCLRRLLVHQAYEKVISIGRTVLKASHPKLIHYEVDLSQPDNYRHLMRGDDLFICLGTTMKKAGSRDAFYEVDHDLVFNIAKTGSLQGMNQLIFVSSIGADNRSLIYYLKVKGELESNVRRLPYWGVHIMRPSVLLGNREDQRPAEQIAGLLAKGLQRFSGSILGDIAPIDADDVAKAMVLAAQSLKQGTHVHHGSEIVKLARQFNH